MDASHGEAHHHGQEEGWFLILPCDWRFLPKLGPLRHGRAGLFSV
ncbi:protein of unknown function [Rhodovastum atsumiense]|nr:protein of unknown function [Rhodovastum atsumiense]